MHRTLRALALLLAIGTPLTRPAGAQAIRIIENLGYIEAGEGFELHELALQSDGPGAPQAAAPPGALTQLLGQKPLQRTLESVPGARREHALTPAPSAEELAGWDPPKRVERIRRLALAGAWEELGADLPALAGEEAGAVYDWLLAQLGQADEVLLPGEVRALLEIAPSELSRARLDALGRVLQRASQRGRTEGLVAWLAADAGEDAAARGRAADLLCAAGLAREARPFLDPLPPDLAAAPSELLERHGLLHAAQADSAATAGATALERDERGRAFELLEAAFQAPDADPADRQRIVARLLGLVRRLPEDQAEAWLRDIFLSRPVLGEAALCGASEELIQLGKRNADPASRGRALVAQAELVARLESVVPDLAPWSRALDLVGLAFRAEAGRLLDQPVQPAQEQWYVQPQRREVPLGILLEAAPGERMLAAIDPGLAAELFRVVVRLAARAGEIERALGLVRAAGAAGGDLADDLARALVADLARALDARQELPRMTSGSMAYVMIGNSWMPSPSASNFGLSVPVPRARQRASLERLGYVLRELAQLGLAPVPPDSLVQTFAACHSPAEVYREEDLEDAFGPLGSIDGGAALALVRDLRSKLSGRWRAPRTQDEAGTRRTEAEVAEEVERGYALAQRLLERALEQDPIGWRPPLEQASLVFDLAEYRHAADPSLERYAPLRERAFEGYAQAAQRFLEGLAAGREARTVEPFRQWFDSALGASELGYLTRETRPDHDQIEALRRALVAAPEAESERLRSLFARSVEGAFSQVAPEVKPRYLRHAMRVLEGHPAARELARIDELYQALGAELALHVELDGPVEIGVGEPFGLRISLRYTTALDREGGGFDRFLNDKVHNPLIGSAIDHRSDFEKRLHGTLEESFELHAVAFHVPGVSARGFGRAGWLEKPLAYALLSARDASVDRIPAVALDVDFSDGKGVAILPVASPVVLVDATRSAGARPVSEPSASLVLDARELAHGTLRLEVRAAGQGVLPDLDELLAGVREVPGYDFVSVQDHGLNLASLDPEAHPTKPHVERSFDVEYAARPDAPEAKAFRFPGAKLAGLELELRRYDDFDVVAAEPIVELDAALLPRGARWALGLALLILLAGGALWLRHSRRAAADVDPLAFPGPPQDPTPLGAIAYLRRVGAAQGPAFAEPVRAELTREIEALERAYFGPNGVHAPPDLGAVLRSWSQRIQGPRV